MEKHDSPRNFRFAGELRLTGWLKCFKYRASYSMMSAYVEESSQKTCTQRKNRGKKRQDARA
jgi:hypothetical protein